MAQSRTAKFTGASLGIYSRAGNLTGFQYA